MSPAPPGQERRRPLLWRAAGVVLLVLLLGGIARLLLRQSPAPPRPSPPVAHSSVRAILLKAEETLTASKAPAKAAPGPSPAEQPAPPPQPAPVLAAVVEETPAADEPPVRATLTGVHADAADPSAAAVPAPPGETPEAVAASGEELPTLSAPADSPAPAQLPEAADPAPPAPAPSAGTAEGGPSDTSAKRPAADAPKEPPGAPKAPNTPGAAETGVASVVDAVRQGICTLDPRGQPPPWVALANAAFFAEDVQPQTQLRLRWNAGVGVQFPDRSEYFWARADGLGKGPNPLTGGRSSFKGETGVDYNDLSLYVEAATARISAFIELPYRSLDATQAGSATGFGDMNVGAKALLLDRDPLLLSLLFRTYVPTGDFNKGLGNGHVSFEPELLLAVKITADTYVQAELAEWVPAGGDELYQGSICHYHASLNQVLYRVRPDVPAIGTVEFSGWSFQGGRYTDPLLGPYQASSGDTYVYVSGGLRVVIGDRIDLGFAAAFAISDHHWADELYRSEVRWRF